MRHSRLRPTLLMKLRRDEQTLLANITMSTESEPTLTPPESPAPTSTRPAVQHELASSELSSPQSTSTSTTSVPTAQPAAETSDFSSSTNSSAPSTTELDAERAAETSPFSATTNEPTPSPSDEVLSGDDNKMRPVIGPGFPVPTGDDHASDHTHESQAGDHPTPQKSSSDGTAPTAHANSGSPSADTGHSTPTTSDAPVLDMSGAQQAIVAPGFLKPEGAIAPAAPAAPAATTIPDEETMPLNPLEGMMKSASDQVSASSQKVMAGAATHSADQAGFFGGFLQPSFTTTTDGGLKAHSTHRTHNAALVGSTTLTSSTVVRAGGPTGTIIGYTGTAGFVPPSATTTMSASATSTNMSEHNSKTPLIAGAATIGVILFISLLFVGCAWLRHRLRDGQSFLCWKGDRQESMEELGFGGDPNSVKPGYKPKDSGDSTSEFTEDKLSTVFDDSDQQHFANGRSEDSPYFIRSDAPAHTTHQPGPVDAMYYGQNSIEYDSGPQYPAPQNDMALTSGTTWAPLRPRKELRFEEPLQEEEEVDEDVSSDPRWSPSRLAPQHDYEDPDDRFTPLPARRARRAVKSYPSAMPAEELVLQSSLPQHVLDYYNIDQSVPRSDDGNPFTDSARYHAGDPTASSTTGSFHTADAAASDGFPAHAMLYSTSSVYSYDPQALHGDVYPSSLPQAPLPLVRAASSSLSSLRQAMTQWPSPDGFRIVQEYPGVTSIHPQPMSPAQLVMLQADTRMRGNPDDEHAQEAMYPDPSTSGVDLTDMPIGIDEQGVKKVLRERSLVVRGDY